MTPYLEPIDTKEPYVNAKKTKVSMSWHSQLRKEINIKKQTKRGSVVRSDYYNRRQKVVNTESSV